MPSEQTKMLFEWLSHQPVLLLLLGLSVADILTGLAAAFITKTVSSDISMKGMTRKAVVWLIIGVTAMVDRVQGDIPVMKIVGLFYCGMEGISITENCARAGVPIPAPLKDALAKLNPTPLPPPVTTVTASATVTTTTDGVATTVAALPDNTHTPPTP